MRKSARGQERQRAAALREDGLAVELRALQEAQRELEASREHYAQLYELSPLARLTLDGSGIIRDLNLTAAELLGQSRRNLVGLSFRLVVCRRDQRRFLTHLSGLRRGLTHAAIELELQPRNRPPVAVQMVTVGRASLVRGGVEYWTTLVDITERKRAVARTAALARLGLLLGSAATPSAAAQAVVDTAYEYCGWDACFVMLYWAASDTLEHLVNVDTIKGRHVPVPSVLHGMPPTPLLRQVLREGPQLILRDRPQDEQPKTVPFGDTKRVSLSLMLVPVRQEGRNIGVMSVQSYLRNAYTQEHLSVLQGLADHAGAALTRLQAQEGLRRLTEQLERRVAERTDELQQYRDHLEELVRQRTRELETANEELRQEVAARQAAEQSLVRVAEELKRSNKELEQFAYAVSHDLQEPLRAVGGYVRLLELRFPNLVDDQTREYINGAAEGASRMEQQLTDLLSLSRVGTQGLVREPVDLAKPLELALKNLQYSILSNRAKVTADPLPTLPVDQSQFIQLFQNLIGNAVKFHGDRPPEVRIGARAEDGCWVVWVRDNGIGIDPQYADRVFQVFQRLHTRKKYPGTGIGLSICQKIVQRHGGRIWVESRPGQGATFLFSIPVDSAILKGKA